MLISLAPTPWACYVSGLIDYGDTDIQHKDHDDAVLTFLDFYRQNSSGTLKYLIFDSKLTTYQNLSKLDHQGIKFLTIRRHDKKIVEQINAIPSSQWKKKRVACAGNKTRVLKIFDNRIELNGYGKKIRQVAITGHGKIKPDLIITNDFELKADEIIRKYSRRWLVEKAISEQIEFLMLPLFFGAAAVILYNGIYTPLKKRSLMAIMPGSNGLLQNQILSVICGLNAAGITLLIPAMMYKNRKACDSFSFAAINLSIFLFMGAGICDKFVL